MSAHSRSDLLVTDRRFATMDGLRGVAALLVAAYHFLGIYGPAPLLGFLAVDLFFVLSGFVLTYVYVPRFERGLSWGWFILQRTARFYPLYLLGFVLGIAWLASAGPQAALLDGSRTFTAAIAYGAFMLPTPESHWLYPINGPSWSLLFELAVNLVFAAMLWRLPTRYLTLVVGLAGAAMLLSIGPPAYLNMGARWTELGGGCWRTLFSFGIGMLIARYLENRPRTRNRFALALPVLIAAPMVLKLGNPVIWMLGAVFAVFPVLVALSAMYEPPEKWRKPLGALGALSFPLYAIHCPVAAVLAPMLANLPHIVGLGIFLSVALSMAYAAQRLVDEPVQKWIRTWKIPASGQRQITTISPAVR